MQMEANQVSDVRDRLNESLLFLSIREMFLIIQGWAQNRGNKYGVFVLSTFRGRSLATSFKEQE